jgi:hypothetical protein
MATFLLHTQEVWDRKDLSLQEKIMLNYCWAWKARGNVVTVTDTFLQQTYSLTQREITDAWIRLQAIGLIKIEYVPAGPRIILPQALDTKSPLDSLDVFDHLY